MSVLALVGCQWGDEGKGKIVDLLCNEAEVIARYQGGANAGHTVLIGDTQYILHTLPTGVLHPDKISVIGNGVVIDPIGFKEEVNDLRGQSVKIGDNLCISEIAHLIMPYHKLLDKVQEKKRGKGKIGTTGRGIGCAYGDKVTRHGIRVIDLKNKDVFAQKVRTMLEFYKPLLKEVYNEEAPEESELIETTWEAGRNFLIPHMTDTVSLMNKYVEQSKHILFEGAQGILLDIDFGTYPYVTSSNPSPGGISTGLGIAPKRIDRILGVVKAYTTRVGEGPLPSELVSEEGDNLRRLGAEFGATTGRPRRCGWFDAPAVKRSIQIAGIEDVAITKLDVLDTLQTIKICTAYQCDGKRIDLFPFGIDVATTCTPIFKEMPGWSQSLAEIRAYDDLPENAKKYLATIEELLGVRIAIVSVGAERSQTIRIDDRLFSF